MSATWDRVRPAAWLVMARIGRGLIVVLGVTFLTFSLMNVLPGTAATALAGPDASPEVIALLEEKLDLNRPFFERYSNWLGDAVRGDLGNSLASGQQVLDILADRLTVTVQLVGLALMISVAAALVTGTLAARRPRGLFDRAATLVTNAGMATPDYVVGILLILVVAGQLELLPSVGYRPLGDGVVANIESLALPAISLSFGMFCRYSRVLRADLIDQLQGEEYVTTARAKGLSERAVLLRHSLKNSLFGLITIIGLNLGVLLGGTVITERVFGLPGVGQQLVTSVQSQDVVIVQGIVVVMAVGVVIASLLTDLTYALLDPRVRLRAADG